MHWDILSPQPAHDCSRSQGQGLPSNPVVERWSWERCRLAQHILDKNLLSGNFSTKIKQWWSNKASVVGWICPKNLYWNPWSLELQIWPYWEMGSLQGNQNEAIRQIITWSTRGRMIPETEEWNGTGRMTTSGLRKSQGQTLHVRPQEEPILQTPWPQTSKSCGQPLCVIWAVIGVTLCKQCSPCAAC